MLTIYSINSSFSHHNAVNRIFMIFWIPAFTFWTFYKCPKIISTY